MISLLIYRPAKSADYATGGRMSLHVLLRAVPPIKSGLTQIRSYANYIWRHRQPRYSIAKTGII